MKLLALALAIGSILVGVYIHSQTIFEAAAAGNIPTLIGRANVDAVAPQESALRWYTHRISNLITELRRSEDDIDALALTDDGLRFLLTARDTHGNSVVHWAVRNRDGATLAFLMKLKDQIQGSSENMKRYRDMVITKNNAGSTALHWAAHVGTAHVVETLVREGIDVNTPNNHGETPLHWAVDWQNAAVVRALLASGASVSAVDADQNTPLHKIPKKCEAQPECALIVSLLVKAGANPEAENVFKRKALHHFDMTHAPPPPLDVVNGKNGSEGQGSSEGKEKKEDKGLDAEPIDSKTGADAAVPGAAIISSPTAEADRTEL